MKKHLGTGYSQIEVIQTQGERVVGYMPTKEEFVVATFNEIQNSYFWSHYFTDMFEAHEYCKEHELMDLAQALEDKYKTDTNTQKVTLLPDYKALLPLIEQNRDSILEIRETLDEGKELESWQVQTIQNLLFTKLGELNQTIKEIIDAV